MGPERTAERPCTGLPDGVQLIEEHQARGPLLGLLEQLPNPRRTQSDEHLDELGPRHEEEGDLRLAGHRAGQQGLSTPGWPQQEHALRDPTTEPLVLLRRSKELDDLLELLDRLVEAGHIGERGLHLLAVVDLHPVLPQVQRLGGAAGGHSPEQQEVDGEDDREGEDPLQQRDQCAGLFAHHLDPLLRELLREERRVEVRRKRGVLPDARLRLPGDGAPGDAHVLHLLGVELLVESVEGGPLGRRGQQVLDEEHQDHGGQDVQE